jgi:hypothetical protein
MTVELWALSTKKSGEHNFIGISQSLGENYELELNREERLKLLLDVIS